MKMVVPKRQLRRLLRWAQFAFIACGVALLTYCGLVLTDAWMFQNRERRQLAQLMAERRNAGIGVPAQTFSSAPQMGLIGRIEIARLGVSAMVVEGTGTTTLRRAAGHIAGTALPGQPGNVGIAGHRDTLFRPLRNIRRNDVITLTTLAGEYSYRVVSTNIVGPGDVAVLAPASNEVLTLVTCYPFYFIGTAPSRFIVRAERVGHT